MVSNIPVGRNQDIIFSMKGHQQMIIKDNFSSGLFPLFSAGGPRKIWRSQKYPSMLRLYIAHSYK